MIKSPIFLVKEIGKKILKRVPGGRFVYEPIHQLYRNCYAVPCKKHRFRKHGYEVMKRVHTLLRSNCVPYYCACGTLLGFVRDGGFLKGERDIDIAIMPERISFAKVLSLFLANDFSFVHAFDYKGRLLEFTVRDKTGITIDVFMHAWHPGKAGYLDTVFLRWLPEIRYPSENANTGLLFLFRGPDEIKTVEINGIEVNIPVNSEEVLDSEFGPWRVPDPSFKSDNIPHEHLPDFVYRITEEEALAHK